MSVVKVTSQLSALRKGVYSVLASLYGHRTKPDIKQLSFRLYLLDTNL